MRQPRYDKWPAAWQAAELSTKKTARKQLVAQIKKYRHRRKLAVRNHHPQMADDFADELTYLRGRKLLIDSQIALLESLKDDPTAVL